MRISTVSVGFTKNLGNFQSMRADATVEVSQGESFDEAIELASAVVMEALDENLTQEQSNALARARGANQLSVS